MHFAQQYLHAAAASRENVAIRNLENLSKGAALDKFKSFAPSPKATAIQIVTEAAAAATQTFHA